MTVARTVVDYLVTAWCITGGLIILAGFIGWAHDLLVTRHNNARAARARPLRIAPNLPPPSRARRS